MVARECALRAATGTTRTGATWVLTPTDAGWETGARTLPKEAALTSARREPWRRRRLWQTSKTFSQAPTMDSTMAQAYLIFIIFSPKTQFEFKFVSTQNQAKTDFTAKSIN